MRRACSDTRPSDRVGEHEVSVSGIWEICGRGDAADVLADEHSYFHAGAIAGESGYGLEGLYNGFATSGHSDSIKPIVPIGQGYDQSSSNVTPPAEITSFFSDLRGDVIRLRRLDTTA